MIELEAGVRRVTFPLPWGPQHVHCYLLRGPEGWTLVDTGFGVPDAEKRWEPVLIGLDAPIHRIVLTHFHPDHVGGAADVAALAGAEVLQGELDYAQCERAWRSEAWPERLAGWLRRHGAPEEVANDAVDHLAAVRPLVRYARSPSLLAEGDSVDGWRVLVLPGHADGHLGLLRDGVMVAGDTLLPAITPAVGLYPESRPDPLADYLRSLQRTAELAPQVAFPGHGEPMRAPARRAREIQEHHRHRLAATRAALGDELRSAYEVSLTLWTEDLSHLERRFALTEALSHLERMRVQGRAERVESEDAVRWRAS